MATQDFARHQNICLPKRGSLQSKPSELAWYACAESPTEGVMLSICRLPTLHEGEQRRA